MLNAHIRDNVRREQHRPASLKRFSFITNVQLKTGGLRAGFSPCREPRAAREKSLTHMIRMSEVKNSIAEHDHQFLMLSIESARQRMVSGFDDPAISDPLPELGLRRPELFAVPADDESCLLPLLTLLFDGPHILHTPSVLKTIRPSPDIPSSKKSFLRENNQAVPPRGKPPIAEAASGFHYELE
jgi:hypothetical protein